MAETEKSKYICVKNDSNQVIWLNAGSWTSGEIKPGDMKQVLVNSENQTVIYADPKKHLEWGAVRLGFRNALTVKGDSDFCVAPLGQCG